MEYTDLFDLYVKIQKGTATERDALAYELGLQTCCFERTYVEAKLKSQYDQMRG